MTSTRTPVHEIRLGLVKAAIWANATEAGLRHNVTVERLYKDAEGRWKSSDSLGREDLLVAANAVSWYTTRHEGLCGER